MIECSNPRRRAEEDLEQRIHVYPVFGRDHVTDCGLDCWCHPTVDVFEPALIIHNVEH